MGHSSGAQLAALMCTDDRYVKSQGFSLTMIKGCVPVDADTFDIPAIIEMAETRARVHHLPLPTFGHRQKFGNDPAKHRDFSAVTHVAKDKECLSKLMAGWSTYGVPSMPQARWLRCAGAEQARTSEQALELMAGSCSREWALSPDGVRDRSTCDLSAPSRA